MPRLFTGLELPEVIKDEILDLHRPLPGVKWINTDDLHLTLRFAGDIDNRVADEFASFLDGISVQSFDMRLSGVGTFGGREPRVLWVGVEAGSQLEMLARAHERAARSAGLKADSRVFKPHITIARLRYAREDVLARFLQQHAGLKTDWFGVSHFSLFSAKPKTGGGPYVVEAQFALSGNVDEAEIAL